MEATVPEILRRDVVVRRADLGKLSRGESLAIEGTDITLTLSEDARVVAALIEKAELTDPRGVLHARLSWLERTLRPYLLDPSAENLEALTEAYDGCFTP
jgi:hypothetical protein